MYKGYIHKGNDCVFGEGTINVDGGISILNVYIRLYGKNPVSAILYLYNKVGYVNTCGDISSRLSFYYQITNNIVRLKIISSGDVPIVIYGTGYETYINNIQRDTNIDTIGYELAEMLN